MLFKLIKHMKKLVNVITKDINSLINLIRGCYSILQVSYTSVQTYGYCQGYCGCMC